MLLWINEIPHFVRNDSFCFVVKGRSGDSRGLSFFYNHLRIATSSLAIRYIAGELYITLQTDSGVYKLYKLNDEIRNRWLDFKFQIRFSRQNDGEIRAFLNDREIINYKGVTSYSEKHGYPAKGRYYFKMGLYRDIMAEPMTIYIDEFRMREMLE